MGGHAQKGCIPQPLPRGRSADPFLCRSYSHRWGAVLACGLGSRPQQPGLGRGARPGGASWHGGSDEAGVGTEGHFQPGVWGGFSRHTCLPGESRGRRPAPRGSGPAAHGASWVLPQGHKVSEPKRASAATPWTADKRSQGDGLCPRSGDSEAPHLLPPTPSPVSFGLIREWGVGLSMRL